MRQVRWTTLGATALACIALIGCSAPREPGSDEPGKKQTLTVKGSDTMVQLAQAWAEAFMKKNPNVEVSVTGGGSNTGIAALMNKSTDICNASRAMKDSERELAKKQGVDVQEFVVAQDALSVVVHRDNPVSELTLAQLKDFYTGKVTDWSGVGGPKQGVVLNSRETSSGTYVFFQEHVLGKGVPFADNAMLQPATSQIVQTVAQDKGGIGYVGLGYVTDKVKALRLKKDDASPGVESTVENVLNNTYPLARPLYGYTSGAPTGVVQQWLDWVRGPEGQDIVKRLDFVPIK
ncbi:MAG: phosphate ABC transporter substrate-binding protein [Armatimonadetes bacterium]|nr:phosphate ABC transporter substrate-binding protein [Armatimonadota bacterium]